MKARHYALIVAVGVLFLVGGRGTPSPALTATPTSSPPSPSPLPPLSSTPEPPPCHDVHGKIRIGAVIECPGSPPVIEQRNERGVRAAFESRALAKAQHRRTF